MEQEPKTNTEETAIPPSEERPKIISMADASVSERYEDVFEVIKPDAVVSVR